MHKIEVIGVVVSWLITGFLGYLAMRRLFRRVGLGWCYMDRILYALMGLWAGPIFLFVACAMHYLFTRDFNQDREVKW